MDQSSRNYFYVIARYNEDISWSDQLPKFVVQKGEHLPNVGREASSYLWYIINHYNDLSGTYCFRQGRVDDHPVNNSSLECDLNGLPDHHGLDIKKFAREINLEIPDKLKFIPGAQFDITTDQIKNNSLDWYQKVYDIIMSENSEVIKKYTLPEYPSNTTLAHILERLWGYIFKLEL